MNVLQVKPRRFWNALEMWSIVERQVLIFPLLVVLFACVSFLFGGRCAAWQWWAAVGLVVGVPFLKKGGWRAALGAAGLFGVLLVVMKGGLPPVFWDNAFGKDTRFYHFPMVQLLFEGWNPVNDPLAEGICGMLGLDLWGMAPLHVAFLNKTMAVLSAVSEKFTGDPTSTTIPGLTLLWLSCAFQAFRAHRGAGRWVGLAAMALVLPIMCRHIFVDMGLAFVACGLLFTMERDLRRDKWDWLHLGVYTVWMATIKLNGLLAAFVFWALFVLAKLWRERKEWRIWTGRLVVFGLAVTALAGVIVWHPLGTSWRMYGHPLYPFKTVDAGKHPVKDLTWDLRMVNADFRQMGKAGVWTHEYISPRLAMAFFRWKTGNQQFNPCRLWYKDESYIHGWVRPALWGMFVLLLLLPRGRLWGLGGLLLTWLVPWASVGYTRYEPWLSALGCLALTLGAKWMEERGGRHLGVILEWGATAMLAMVVAFWVWRHARDVEFKAVELSEARQRVRHYAWMIPASGPTDAPEEDFTPRYNHLTAMENHCRLLVKELGWEGRTCVLGAGGRRFPEDDFHRSMVHREAWTLDERQWFAPEAEKDRRLQEDMGEPWYAGNVWDGFGDSAVAEPWCETPWQMYWVPLGDRTSHILDYYMGTEPRPGESRGERLMRRAKAVVKAWGMTYPKEAWKWLKGRRFAGNSALELQK